MPLQNPSAMEGDVCSECNETITKKTCGHARKCMYCEKAICKSCKRKCQNETWIKAKKKMWIHIECQKRMHRELTCVDCNTLSKNLGTILANSSSMKSSAYCLGLLITSSIFTCGISTSISFSFWSLLK